MKKFIFAVCAVFALAGVTSISAAEYEYVFQPSGTDDGSSTNLWGGALFLDSSSSSGGTLADIDLSDSFLRTEFGKFYLDQSLLILPPVGPFTWTPTTITAMNISGGVLLDGTGHTWNMTANSVSATNPDPTATGQWVRSTSVPDATTTALLIGLAAVGLFGLSELSQRRHLAMARSK